VQTPPGSSLILNLSKTKLAAPCSDAESNCEISETSGSVLNCLENRFGTAFGEHILDRFIIVGLQSIRSACHGGKEETMVGFNSEFFLNLRREALRRRVWFRVLNCTERALLYLVPRCMETPKNVALIDVLARIIVKIKEALKSPVADIVNQVGKPLALRLSRIAQEWGHKTAGEWASDTGFARYLALRHLNSVARGRL